jgi:LPS O-antigen subunit length determinant protein (WzzB/FepE family)
VALNVSSFKEKTMANTQNEEFQFPDEIEETKGKPVGAQDDGGFELEIQDDTPVEDQKAKPLPNEVKEELEKDNLMEYSNKVKMRLEQMKKAWHDERRAKETADREREEAINYAKHRGINKPLSYVLYKRRNAGIEKTWVIQDLTQWLEEKQ